jgi:phenylpropionate dioxygenase-like ring-hydroxylating dioxygenase large terminal subunit
MKPILTPSHYYADETFQQELLSIFSANWFFVCLKSDIPNENDYLVIQIGDQSVIIQNFGDTVSAFNNVCSHRFSQIHCETRGNRKLQCPYHGWIYDKSGTPYAIPSRPKFDDLTSEVIQSLRLQSWSVEFCDNFVFICKNPAQSLQSFLGEDFFRRLEQISSSLNKEIDFNQEQFESNWKISVENTLESYHVGFIHPQTFHKMGLGGMDFTFSNAHSAWHADINANFDKKFGFVEKLVQKNEHTIKGYTHLFIYPNFTIATTNGYSYSLQLFQPINAKQTRFISRVFSSKAFEGLDEKYTEMLELFQQGIIKFNRQVFLEDKEICEKVQIGSQAATTSGILSDEEGRVVSFQQAYQKSMVNRNV